MCAYFSTDLRKSSIVQKNGYDIPQFTTTFWHGVKRSRDRVFHRWRKYFSLLKCGTEKSNFSKIQNARGCADLWKTQKDPTAFPPPHQELTGKCHTRKIQRFQALCDLSTVSTAPNNDTDTINYWFIVVCCMARGKKSWELKMESGKLRRGYRLIYSNSHPERSVEIL